jgi:prolyl-tRNA editing enzyme YbaK/EbsC (Cys-tRNA(Pro) deacylase)
VRGAREASVGAAGRRLSGSEAYDRTVSAWPESVERVAAFLREAGAEARLEEFPEGTPTAREAAQAVGCELAQIVKSLVFDCDGSAVIVLVPGDRRADMRKVGAAAGCAKARVARADEVERATGFTPGAVAPFPLEHVRVFVDRTLLVHETVWIGAGSPRHVAGLAPTELVRLARARPMDAVEAAT